MSDNRTTEFLSLARSLPEADRLPMSTGLSSSSSLAATAGKKNDSTNTAAYQELKNFHSTAAGISRDIASTSALLTELTDLVRHGSSSVFDGEQQKMNQLVVRIKTSIENLNSRLDQTSRSVQQQKRRLGEQAGEEAANMVDGLQTVFAEAASDFKKVLQQRTETMKEKTDFQKQVYDYSASDDDDNPMPNMSALSAPPPVYSSAPSSLSGAAGASPFPTLDLASGFMAPGEDTGSSLPRPLGVSAPNSYNSSALGNEFRQRRSTSDMTGSHNYYSPSPLTPLDIQRMEEESGASQMMQLIPDQDYLQQRADAMSTVETQMVELGQIFNKLAVMVNEHRDLVQRVDDNVQDANANINLSLNVLTDTLTSLRTNRMLALRVFSVLVLFIIFFIIFFA